MADFGRKENWVGQNPYPTGDKLLAEVSSSSLNAFTQVDDWARTFVRTFDPLIIGRCKHVPNQPINRQTLICQWIGLFMWHKNAYYSVAHLSV